MTAPFDRYLAALEPGDSTSEQMRKLLRAYPSLGKGFTRVRKQDDGELAEAAEEVAEGEGGDANLEAELDEEEDDRQDEESRKHLASQVADLFVEAHPGLTRPEALRHLMHTPRGAELLRRLHRAQKLQKKEQTMSREQNLQQLAKDFGPIKLAKYLIENPGDGHKISEHEFVRIVEGYAKANGRSFADLYTASDFDGLAIRKATQLLKGFPVAEARSGAVAGGADSGAAYDAIVAKAEELRKSEPSLSREQAFSKAYQQNADLARAERQANRPVA